MFASICNPV